MASAWYIKALERSEHLHGKNTLQVASLLIRLSELAVLESNSDQYQKYFDLFTRAYLLTQEEDAFVLLDPLTDLSWALCVKGKLSQVQAVNTLISQIKQLQQEERQAASSVA